VNYFELYPGDYLRDTSRLSLTDHGAYLKLMLAYYGDEQALPADYDGLYQIAAAITAGDKTAVRKIADRYFPIASDGLRRNNRIDAEIAKAQKRIAQARENGAKHKPGKNPAGMPAGNPAGHPAGTQPVTRSGEALHTPHATSQGESSGHTLSSLEGATTAGRACRLMRDAGCMRSNPSHAGLLQALAAGVTPEALGDTAREGIEKSIGDPFAWAIATAMKRHQQAQRPVIAGPPRIVPQSRHVAGTAGFLGASHEATNPDSDLVLDADRRGLGEPVPAEPRRLPRG
jgi:uncharacterized protein YdaU (DUF1376 family)